MPGAITRGMMPRDLAHTYVTTTCFPADWVAAVDPLGPREEEIRMTETTEPAPEEPAPYGGDPNVRKVRIHHLQKWKSEGIRWPMLTAYDQYAAQIFDEAGIPVLLVGDSASNNVFANETSLPVTADELIPLARAVSRSVDRALVVADLPFGSDQGSPEQAFDTAVRFMKETGAHAVKLEGGLPMVPQVEHLTDAGIPVMAHIGFT